jgi:hypothetical protein
MRGTAIKLRASGVETHLWIIVTNPQPKTNLVLAFNLTDVVNYPTSRCIVEIGEHERITMRSAIRYFSPKIWDAELLQKRIEDGTFEQFENASDELIQKITNGAYEDDIPDAFLRYLPPKSH